MHTLLGIVIGPDAANCSLFVPVAKHKEQLAYFAQDGQKSESKKKKIRIWDSISTSTIE
jgi:hypothetical protein